MLSGKLTTCVQTVQRLGPHGSGSLARHHEDWLRYQEVPGRRDQRGLRVPASRYVAPSYLLVLRSTRLIETLIGNIIGSFDKVKQPSGQPIVFPNGQTHF